MSRPKAQVPALLHPPTPTYTHTHLNTHPYLHPPPTPYHVPLHICHSGKREREGGIEQWKERREARNRQLIVWPVGEAERLRERERERLRKRERRERE